MFNQKLVLTANISILPFFIFYKSKCIDEICEIEEIGEYRKKIHKHYAEIYKSLKNTCTIMNFDEVNLLFDKFYPKEELNYFKDNISKFYMQVLSKLAKSFISHRDGKIIFKYWKSQGEEDFIGPYSGINKIAFWNYLNRIFTTDLLVMRYLLDNGMEDERNLEGFTSTIMLADSQLEGILKKGVAETHIHKNAAINFYISWQDLMNLKGKSRSNYKEHMLKSEMFYNEIDLVPHLLAIAIVRFIMAGFLQSRVNENWNDFIISEYDGSSEDSSTSTSCDDYKYYDKQIKSLCDAIADGKEVKENEYNFFKIWAHIEEKFNIVSYENEKKSSYKNDILKYIFKNYGDNNIILENILLFKAMSYIDKSNDVLFGKLFINYIRIKNKILQTKVQSNLVKGLSNFKEYFKRSTSKTYEIKEPYDEKNYWKILIENQLQNIYLEKLELRAGIANGNINQIEKSIKNVMINFLEAYKEVLEEKEILYGETHKEILKDREILCEEFYKAGLQYRKIFYTENYKYPKIALIFHLQKVKDKHEYEKCWVDFENKDYKQLHFREHRNVYSKQVQALNLIREKYKGISDYIVGLDAASSENDTEPWVFAPIYEKARDSKRGDLIYRNSNNADRIKTLGFTFHVGEDFRHIVTGLRRIDEVVDNLKFHAGDRIGHGIALGIDVDKWVNNNRVVTLPRIEYMENMLWIWGIYKDGYYDESFDISYLEQEIMNQAEKIYEYIEGITIYILWKAYKSKFDEFNPNEDLLSNNLNASNNRLFCKYGKTERGVVWNIETLSHANHCICYLKKMLEPIQVEVKYDKSILFKQLQKIVCHKISTKAIVVETNPTSNVAIGEMESIFEHYIHNLNNRGLSSNNEKENSMMVTINSDDPSVFNTNVSNELAYIFYSLEEKGYDRENILQWIDKVRQYGMDSSFIEDSNLSIRDKINEIKNIIAELKQ